MHETDALKNELLFLRENSVSELNGHYTPSLIKAE